MKTVILDLDGTITDPEEGITRSIKHALIKLGRAPHPVQNLRKYIGPNLKITFSELMETADVAELGHAIEMYRERYISIGYRENLLYEGIREVLARLLAAGSSLCIATTKRKDIAIKVLEFLGVITYFIQVYGCDLLRAKSDLLRDILQIIQRSK